MRKRGKALASLVTVLALSACGAEPQTELVSFAHPTRVSARKAHFLPVPEYLDAYGISALHKRGITGKGTTVIIPAIDTFAESDLKEFARTNDLPPFKASEIGSPPTGVPFGESTMDLQIVHAVAPDAKLVVVYLPRYIGTEVDAIEQTSKRYVGAMWSWSLGWCEDADPDFARSVAGTIADGSSAGSAHFASTGDSAGYECYPSGKLFQPPRKGFIGLIMPSAAPAVTAVGGTRILVGGKGTVLKETPWFRSVTLSGSGGGRSDVFDGRTVPDVAADADPATGMVFVLNGSLAAAGGTSASAPFWAGLGALTTQALSDAGAQRQGTFNDLIAAVATNHPKAFRHPKVGANSVAVAQRGRDEVTGWGAPDGAEFVRAAVEESQ